MADAGKIMFTLKGDYDETVPYEILDVVTYDSSLYVSRINNNLGYPPSDTEKWQLLIQKSDVVGVKGDAEANYRTGLVNITPSDIGLGNLKDVAFSGDYADLSNTPKDWEANTLNTLAEIEAATEENLIAGALAVKELFTSVSNGKKLVASAITDMGVSTASNATFSTMATNISNIKTGIDFDAVMPYVGYEEVKLSSLNDTIPSLNKYVLNRLKAKSVILLSGFATKSAISAYLGFADNSNLQMMTTSTGSNKIYGSFDNKLANSMYIGACAMEITPMTTNYSIVGQNVDFTNYYTNYVSCLRFIVPDAQEITLLYGNYIYGSYQIVTTTIPDDGYRYRIIKLYAEQRYNPNTDSSYQPYELKFDMSQSTFGKNSVQPITKRVEYFGGSHTYKTWARVETIENLNAGDIIKVRGANDGGEVILLVKSYEKY